MTDQRLLPFKGTDISPAPAWQDALLDALTVDEVKAALALRDKSVAS